MTSMINPHLPLELDDGREVKLDSVGDVTISVNVVGPVCRTGVEYDEDLDSEVDEADFYEFQDHGGGEELWFYELETGLFSGGNARLMYVLRNRDNPKDYITDIE